VLELSCVLAHGIAARSSDESQPANKPLTLPQRSAKRDSTLRSRPGHSFAPVFRAHSAGFFSEVFAPRR
jgi:hypothetical protein